MEIAYGLHSHSPRRPPGPTPLEAGALTTPAPVLPPPADSLEAASQLIRRPLPPITRPNRQAQSRDCSHADIKWLPHLPGQQSRSTSCIAIQRLMHHHDRTGIYVCLGPSESHFVRQKEDKVRLSWPQWMRCYRCCERGRRAAVGPGMHPSTWARPMSAIAGSPLAERSFTSRSRDALRSSGDE